MWTSAITAYFHYLGFMVAFGSLIVEMFNLKKEMTIDEAKRVFLADAVYGLSVLIVLVTGVLRVIYFGKGSDYYLNNPFFYAKMGLFLFVGLLSLYPTVTFISWLKGLQNGEVPALEVAEVNRLSWLLKGELFGFTLLPLLAAIMARISGWG
jgi:putative membrane protein